MKKVLMVAHQFPPMAGSGIQRTLKFVRYLPSFGYSSAIITRDERRLELRDDSNLCEVPEGTSVYRLAACDPVAWPGVFGKYLGKLICRKILIPDGEWLWYRLNRERMADIVRQESPDVIYTTSYPYSDHLAGLYLKKHFPDIPWVADFRDEWSNNPYHVYKDFRSSKEKSMERSVLLNADRLITNTPIMLEHFLHDNPQLKNKFFVIPNGYDPEDYINLKSDLPKNEKFTLTYCGLLYGRRSPKTFFAALAYLVASRQIPRDSICINLIGNYKKAQLQAEIDSFTLTDIVQLHDYMPHLDCLKALSDSDALLIIEGSGPGAEAFYTGKVFEYMNMNRDILGVVPSKGACADMIRTTNTGVVADFDNVDEIRESILRLYTHWREGSRAGSPDKELIARYSRQNLTGELVKILNT